MPATEIIPVFTAIMPVKLTRAQLHRHAGNVMFPYVETVPQAVPAAYENQALLSGLLKGKTFSKL